MAYLGKEFTFDKDENFDAFINAMAEKQEKALAYLSFKPNYMLLKNGDEYVFVVTIKEKDIKMEFSFKPGVPFEESLAGGAIKAKSVISLDGDTFTQVQDLGSGTVTYKREFSPNQLKVTITSSLWDGTAYRYYVPA